MLKYFSDPIEKGVRNGGNEVENAKTWQKSVLLEVSCARNWPLLRNDDGPTWRVETYKCFL